MPSARALGLGDVRLTLNRPICGKARIFLSALVTPASISDNTPVLDLLDWVRARWHLKPKLAVGDGRYGTVPNIVGLEQRGIKAYLATSDFSQ